MADEKNEDLKKCGFCKKTAPKLKRYYRNGRFYCNMNCWTKAKKEAAEQSSAEETVEEQAEA